MHSMVEGGRHRCIGQRERRRSPLRHGAGAPRHLPCFAGEEMNTSERLKDLPVEEARARMLGAVSPGAPERIALDRHALGRVLAEPIAAVRDQPPFDASAMDGYAVPLAGGWGDGFRLVGESAAGRPYAGPPPRSGETVRVFTGARVPEGCAVVVQERATRHGDHVRFDGAPPALGAHVRVQGGDFQRGETLLPAGLRLDAWRLALAASAGRDKARVFPQPRGLRSCPPARRSCAPAQRTPTDAQIFDSNGPALSTLIAQWGGRPLSLDPVRDSQAAILAALDSVGAELIVTVGGASVGDYDLVKPALEKLGLGAAGRDHPAASRQAHLVRHAARRPPGAGPARQPGLGPGGGGAVPAAPAGRVAGG